MGNQLNFDGLVPAESSVEDKSSAGHKLGQLVGDWFEEYFVLPLLAQVGDHLKLFLDARFIQRKVRGSKIVWTDEYGNCVDYDYVLELGGTEEKIGIPVAFFETFWRRGARHSKDKARDDSGKLMPMRSTYPTARFLGIVAAGVFTGPARELLRSREIDLFYVPKDKVVESFSRHGLTIDYPDKASEEEKARVLAEFEKLFTNELKTEIAATLSELVGRAAITSYTDRVRARLSALPQEIRLILRHESKPIVFSTLDDVSEFLNAPRFSMDDPSESYVYEVTYSDGTEFELEVDSIEAIRNLHAQIQLLADHLSSLSR